MLHKGSISCVFKNRSKTKRQLGPCSPRQMFLWVNVQQLRRSGASCAADKFHLFIPKQWRDATDDAQLGQIHQQSFIFYNKIVSPPDVRPPKGFEHLLHHPPHQAWAPQVPFCPAEKPCKSLRTKREEIYINCTRCLLLSEASPPVKTYGCWLI